MPDHDFSSPENPSSSSHFTLGPSKPMPFDSQPTPSHLRQRFTDLESDNQSLLRRLNLVLQEFERVKREKTGLQQRMQTSLSEQSEMERIITSEDNIDKVNKFLHEDLEFETKKKHKMKTHISELDYYRGELFMDLKKMKELQEEAIKDN